jgi:quercetin dioxygenase-like cupin family protein
MSLPFGMSTGKGKVPMRKQTLLRMRTAALMCAATILLASMAVAAAAPGDAVVVSLIAEQLADTPGEELDMITVEYPPGGSSPPHRHDAYVLVYVLKGSLQMQVRGQKLVTLKAGESFLERPDDIHEVSRNASRTRPAKFLVVALKAAGKPLTREAAPAPQ